MGELFMPSEKILRKIFWDEKAHRQYTTFPADVPEMGWGRHLSGLGATQIPEFYRLQFKRELDEDTLANIVLTAADAVRNAQLHGSKEGRPFVHALFMARFGVCQGFKDEGGYFQDPVVKHQFENKIPIRAFDTEVPGHRIGVNKFIYNYADILEVDIEEGVLYCAKLFGTLREKIEADIAQRKKEPGMRGERWGDYFFNNFPGHLPGGYKRTNPGTDPSWTTDDPKNSEKRRGQTLGEFWVTIDSVIEELGITPEELIEGKNKLRQEEDDTEVYELWTPIYIRLREMEYNWQDCLG